MTKQRVRDIAEKPNPETQNLRHVSMNYLVEIPLCQNQAIGEHCFDFDRATELILFPSFPAKNTASTQSTTHSAHPRTDFDWTVPIELYFIGVF